MSVPPVLRRRALNRASLARQLLLERAPIPALDALEHLVGLQAQAPQPPYFGLWTRLARFAPTDLEALIIDRRAVRIALQRGTLHAVSARDGLGLRPLLQPVFDRWLRQVEPRLSGASGTEVAAAARGLLVHEPLTNARLVRRLKERWPDADATALGQFARGALALVQVPPRGMWSRSGPAAHTTIEAWLGAPLDHAGSVEDLLLRYLAAFGPATIRDAQVWCGLRGLGDVAARLRPRLRTFRDESGRELLDLPDAPRPDPAHRPPSASSALGQPASLTRGSLARDQRRAPRRPASPQRRRTGHDPRRWIRGRELESRDHRYDRAPHRGSVPFATSARPRCSDRRRSAALGLGDARDPSGAARSPSGRPADRAERASRRSRRTGPRPGSAVPADRAPA